MRRSVREVIGVTRAKLGRCSFCMGLALSGAVIGWAALAAVAALWPGFPFLTLLALWPISFTVLWLLHIATFGIRAVASERRGMPEPDMTRRRMVAGVFASALGLAILASLVAAPQALAGGKCCVAGITQCPKGQTCSGHCDHCRSTGLSCCQ